jgi:hypothetical protein
MKRVHIESCEPRRLFAAAMTFVVTNVNDSGAGSLRQAITQANVNINNPGEVDTIAINITGTNKVVALTSALPDITDPVTLGVDINGAQPAGPSIELNGTSAGAGKVGLAVKTSGSSILSIAVRSFTSHGILIQGNDNVVNLCNIGTNLTATTALGNGGAGVYIQGTGNIVAANRIVNNTGDGICVFSGGGNDLSFSGSYGQIHSNGGLAIDLADDGITPNDTNDVDTGPNERQNWPVLTGATLSNGKVTISGTINTAPNRLVFLDFFANPTSAREGRQPLALRISNQPSGASVTTDAQGNASFTFQLEATPTTPGGAFGTIATGSFFTAVATAFDTTTGDLNSSEFSPSVPSFPAWLSSNSIASWNSGTRTLTVTGAATIIGDPDAYNPIIDASGAAAVLTINPSSSLVVHVDTLNLSNGASATITSLGAARTATNHRVLVARTVNIDNNSSLDLTDNDLIVDYSGSSQLSNIEGDVRQGFNLGNWLGKGIRSSIAQNNDNFHLGVADNALLPAPYGVSNGGQNFDGVNVDMTTVLVKFTHRVDLNLDGLVNDDDAIAFNTNFERGASAFWSIGDVNMDGVFSDDDSILFGTYFESSLPRV